MKSLAVNCSLLISSFHDLLVAVQYVHYERTSRALRLHCQVCRRAFTLRAAPMCAQCIPWLARARHAQLTPRPSPSPASHQGSGACAVCAPFEVQIRALRLTFCCRALRLLLASQQCPAPRTTLHGSCGPAKGLWRVAAQRAHLDRADGKPWTSKRARREMRHLTKRRSRVRQPCGKIMKS